jgi:hypothetical protein
MSLEVMNKCCRETFNGCYPALAVQCIDIGHHLADSREYWRDHPEGVSCNVLIGDDAALRCVFPISASAYGITGEIGK